MTAGVDTATQPPASGRTFNWLLVNFVRNTDGVRDAVAVSSDGLLIAKSDGLDRDGSTALHEAAYSAEVDAVRHLLARGADPALRDSRFRATPLGWCQHRHGELGSSPAHQAVEQILGPVTPAATE